MEWMEKFIRFYTFHNEDTQKDIFSFIIKGIKGGNFMKKDIKLSLFLGFLGAIGVLAIIPYQLEMSKELLKDIKTPIPFPLLITLTVIQQFVILSILSFIGVFLQKRTNLKMSLFKNFSSYSKKWIGMGVLGSLIGTMIIVFIDKVIFMPRISIPEITGGKAVWWKGFLASFYGGITEELLLRLFVMTLIVWIFSKFFRTKKENIPSSVYWLGIILTAILFGLGHLPATKVLFGDLTTILIIRAIVLNGVLGIWFGYLYWKKGLEYAIISHFCADIFLHVVFSNL